MFDKIISFCLKYRVLVICFYILLMSFGLIQIMNTKIEVFPDLNKPTVSLLAESNGLAPDEIEKLILIPLENAVNGTAGVTRLSSAASTGYGVVKAEFDWKTDIYQARQSVTERLTQINDQLPANTRVVMTPISSIMGEVMQIGLIATDNALSSIELREIAENQVKRRLLSIQGVSSVSLLGGDVKQYHIILDLTQMTLQGISLSQVQEAVSQIGLNGTGGFLQKPYTEYLIRTLARPQDIHDLKQLVVAPALYADMPAVTLGQIADIQQGFDLNKRGTAGINGQDGILISIVKQPAVDTVTLTRQLESELSTLEKSLPKTVKLEKDIFKQSRFIQNAIDNIAEALTTGSILIAVILFLFLLSFKGVAIVLTVIPATFIMTACVFSAFDITINTMTLGGIAMALGSLIDDAIIGVANAYKRLKENRRKKQPQGVLHVVFLATKEVRNSILFSTFLIFLVFLPLFALAGIEGKIFTPLALAFILSMILSTVVAVTLTPVLSAYLLPSIKTLGRVKDAFLIRKIKQGHQAILSFLFHHLRSVLIGFTTLCLMGIGLFFSFGVEFLPPFNEGSFNISLASAPGTNLFESNRIGQLAEKSLLQMNSVESTGRKLGRAELDEHALGININEIEVRLKDNPTQSKEEIMTEIREKLNIPGTVLNIGQPISHRIDLLISGVQSGLAIKIFGTDETAVSKTTNEIEQLLKGISELTDVARDMQIKTPQVRIRLNPKKAARYGVQLGRAVTSIETALAGSTIGTIMQNERLYDIILKVQNSPSQLEDLKKIPLETLYSSQTPLGLIADIELVPSQNEIIRENGSRRSVVGANFKTRDTAQTVAQVQEKLNILELPEGVFLTMDGQFQTQQAASRNILILSILSFLLMYGALYVNFKNLNIATQLMLTIPLALVGGVLGVFLTSGVLSVATIIGFIALVGIAIRNGILLIDVYRTQEKKQKKPLSPKRLIYLTQERLEPVMMTTLTSVIGFLPLIVAGNATGKEILYPLAVVMSFGLLTTTILNMFITPLIYYRFHPKHEEEDV